MTTRAPVVLLRNLQEPFSQWVRRAYLGRGPPLGPSDGFNSYSQHASKPSDLASQRQLQKQESPTFWGRVADFLERLRRWRKGEEGPPAITCPPTSRNKKKSSKLWF